MSKYLLRPGQRRTFFCTGGGFQVVLSALLALPLTSMVHIPFARSQQGGLSKGCIDYGWCTDAETAIIESALPKGISTSQVSASPKSVPPSQVAATLHDQLATCLGESLHVFAADLSGDPTLISAFQSQMLAMNDAATAVCYSPLYAKLDTGQQALVLQRIRVANTCTQDAESELADGDSQTATRKLAVAIRSFQIAEQTLRQAAAGQAVDQKFVGSYRCQ